MLFSLRSKFNLRGVEMIAAMVMIMVLFLLFFATVAALVTKYDYRRLYPNNDTVVSICNGCLGILIVAWIGWICTFIILALS